MYTILTCTAVHFYMVHKRSIYTICLYRYTILHGTQTKYLYNLSVLRALLHVHKGSII